MIHRRTLLGAMTAAAVMGGPAQGRAPSRLALAAFTDVLGEIDSPEGIAATPDGRLVVSDPRAAVSVIAPDESVHRIGASPAPAGIAIDRQGCAIVANMGLLTGTPGPLQRIDLASGAVETLVEALEDRTLVASNCPVVARNGTIYCSHSSWGPAQNIGTTDPSGFVYMVTPDGRASIVARGLRGANGLVLDRGDRHLYVSCTPEGRIRRWRRCPDGTLDRPEPYGPVLGTVVPDQRIETIRALDRRIRATLGYTDNIAFDADGNLWVAMPFADRLVAITPAGARIDIVHDPDGTVLNMPTSLCWGGPGLRDLYVVSRKGSKVVRARTQAKGMPLANWSAAG